MTSTIGLGMIARIITCSVKYCSRTQRSTHLNKNFRVHVSCDSYLLCLSDNFISLSDYFLFAITHFGEVELAAGRHQT
jgi:hypothetical protein